MNTIKLSLLLFFLLLIPTASQAATVTYDTVDTTADPVILTGTSTESGSTITNIEYQTNGTGGSWTACTATDGAYDSDEEGFSCDLGTLGGGGYTTYIRTSSEGADFVSLGETSRDWYAIAVNPNNGDVYAGVYNGDIYKQTAGTGSFAALGETSRDWWGLAINPNTNDVYAVANWGDIYKQTNSTGSFVSISAGVRQWRGIAVNSNTNDVYAGAYGTDIFKQTNGIGTFDALGTTGTWWDGVAVSSSTNDVYAVANGTGIYKQTNGTGAFVELGETVRNWQGVTINSNTNDVYVTVGGGDIYKQTNATGSFDALGQTSRPWRAIAANSATNDVYATVDVGGVYKKSGATTTIDNTTFTVDSTAPAITLNPITAAENPTLTGTATDADGTVASVEFQMSTTTGVWTACTADDAAFDEASEAFTCALGTFGYGTFTAYVRSTDDSANTTTGGSESTEAFTRTQPSGSSQGTRIVRKIVTPGPETPTIESLTKRLNELKVQLAILLGTTGGGGGTTQPYLVDLPYGSTHPDVSRLQQYLVSQGFLTMPQGVAYGFYGHLTEVAVAKFQETNNINPALGYFGPLTRGFLNP